MKRAFCIVMLAVICFSLAFSQNAGSTPAGGATVATARGESLLKVRQYKAALEEFRAALKADENHGAAHWGMALAYEGLGNVPGTVNALKHAVETDATNLDARIKLGNYYVVLSNNGSIVKYLAEAETLVRETLARDPHHIEGHILLANLLYVRGDKEAALEKLNRAVALNPKRVESYLSLARYFVAANDATRAEEVYRRAIDTNRGAAIAHLEYGRFLASRNRVQEAEAAFRRAVEVEPNNPGARLVLEKFMNRPKDK